MRLASGVTLEDIRVDGSQGLADLRVLLRFAAPGSQLSTIVPPIKGLPTLDLWPRVETTATASNLARSVGVLTGDRTFEASQHSCLLSR